MKQIQQYKVADCMGGNGSAWADCCAVLGFNSLVFLLILCFYLFWVCMWSNLYWNFFCSDRKSETAKTQWYSKYNPNWWMNEQRPSFSHQNASSITACSVKYISCPVQCQLYCQWAVPKFCARVISLQSLEAGGVLLEVQSLTVPCWWLKAPPAAPQIVTRSGVRD